MLHRDWHPVAEAIEPGTVRSVKLLERKFVIWRCGDRIEGGNPETVGFRDRDGTRHPTPKITALGKIQKRCDLAVLTATKK
ncbi:MAG: hypothetical protein ACLFM4_00830 [Phormidium sp.]